MASDIATDYPVVTALKPRQGYRLWLEFADGKSGEADLSDVSRNGSAGLWRNRREFRNVKLRDGTASWVVGEDIVDYSPTDLYIRATGAKWEDMIDFRPERPRVVKARDASGDSIHVEFQDGTSGYVKVCDSLMTGEEFSHPKFASNTHPAPWGNVLWKNKCELSAEAILASLSGSGS